MESVNSSSSMSDPQKTYTYDEFFMQQSLHFSDSLKDLKNLRKQMYSAAEYFELSYSRDDQEQVVMETLKDYTIKALISTVDHLGSMACKVNNFLDEKIGEVGGIELRFSCIEQRVRACQEFIDCAALYQQSLALKTPRHQKRYIFPVVETMNAVGQTKSKFHSCCSLCSEDDHLHQFQNAVQATPPSLVRNEHSASPFSQSSSSPGTFSFPRIAPNKVLEKPEKQRVLPQYFPLLRCGSIDSRSPTPIFPLIRSGSLVRRSQTPSSGNAKWQYPLQHRRASPVGNPAERERTKEIEQYSSKSKRLLRAFF